MLAAIRTWNVVARGSHANHICLKVVGSLRIRRGSGSPVIHPPR